MNRTKEFIIDMFELNIPEEIINLILSAEKDDNLKESRDYWKSIESDKQEYLSNGYNKHLRNLTSLMIKKFNGDVNLAIEDRKAYIELCRSLNFIPEGYFSTRRLFNLH
jgi:hypothetical protein